MRHFPSSSSGSIIRASSPSPAHANLTRRPSAGAVAPASARAGSGSTGRGRSSRRREGCRRRAGCSARRTASALGVTRSRVQPISFGLVMATESPWYGRVRPATMRPRAGGRASRQVCTSIPRRGRRPRSRSRRSRGSPPRTSGPAGLDPLVEEHRSSAPVVRSRAPVVVRVIAAGRLCRAQVLGVGYGSRSASRVSNGGTSLDCPARSRRRPWSTK